LLRKLTYLLTPWCRVLLEKLIGLQLVKKFPAFHGTRRFITALTSVRHLSLSWASPIQSTYPHSTSRRSILILSNHLRPCLPSGLFTSGFPTKALYTPSLHPHAPHAVDYWLIKRASRLSPAQRTARVKCKLLSQCQYFEKRGTDHGFIQISCNCDTVNRKYHYQIISLGWLSAGTFLSIARM